MKTKILLALAYILPTMLLGLVWHLVLFQDKYDELGVYNRKEPIIPLGFLTMIIQGVIMAYLYPFYAKGQITMKKALSFNLIMGLFIFSVTTLANAAKIEVTSMSEWLIIQTAFTLLQFLTTGILMGLIKFPKS